MADPDQHLIDDPSFAAGVLLGRKQAVTDVMERLLAPDADDPESIIAALVKWCAQTDQEIEDELQLILPALAERDR